MMTLTVTSARINDRTITLTIDGLINAERFEKYLYDSMSAFRLKQDGDSYLVQQDVSGREIFYETVGSVFLANGQTTIALHSPRSAWDFIGSLDAVFAPEYEVWSRNNVDSYLATIPSNPFADPDFRRRVGLLTLLQIGVVIGLLALMDCNAEGNVSKPSENLEGIMQANYQEHSIETASVDYLNDIR